MFQPLNFRNKAINIVAPLKREFWNYRVPVSSNVFSCSGACLAFCLIVQLLTGSLLAIHYEATAEGAFDSVRRIVVDLEYGDTLRFMHSNTASTFFILIYIHVGKAIYYGSYTGRYKLLWLSGFIILIALMATAFSGYVLPWGQMSFWAATVVINFFTAIPVFGEDITHFIWGDIVPSTVTIKRFYVIHFTLPWILFFLVLKHILILHRLRSGAANTVFQHDTVPFYPLYLYKDFQAIVATAFFLFEMVAHHATFFMNPINFWKANPMVTPKAIVPEWYFLPFYGILRAIKNKALGVIMMFLSILMIGFLPYLHSSKTNPLSTKLIGQVAFALFIADFILLGKAASKPYIPELDLINYLLVTCYFLFFFFLTLSDWIDSDLRPYFKHKRYTKLGLPRITKDSVLFTNKRQLIFGASYRINGKRGWAGDIAPFPWGKRLYIPLLFSNNLKYSLHYNRIHDFMFNITKYSVNQVRFSQTDFHSAFYSWYSYVYLRLESLLNRIFGINQNLRKFYDFSHFEAVGPVFLNLNNNLTPNPRDHAGVRLKTWYVLPAEHRRKKPRKRRGQVLMPVIPPHRARLRRGLNFYFSFNFLPSSVITDLKKYPATAVGLKKKYCKSLSSVFQAFHLGSREQFLLSSFSGSDWRKKYQVLNYSLNYQYQRVFKHRLFWFLTNRVLKLKKNQHYVNFFNVKLLRFFFFKRMFFFKKIIKIKKRQPFNFIPPYPTNKDLNFYYLNSPLDRKLPREDLKKYFFKKIKNFNLLTNNTAIIPRTEWYRKKKVVLFGVLLLLRSYSRIRRKQKRIRANLIKYTQSFTHAKKIKKLNINRNVMLKQNFYLKFNFFFDFSVKIIKELRENSLKQKNYVFTQKKALKCYYKNKKRNLAKKDIKYRKGRKWLKRIVYKFFFTFWILFVPRKYDSYFLSFQRMKSRVAQSVRVRRYIRYGFGTWIRTFFFHKTKARMPFNFNKHLKNARLVFLNRRLGLRRRRIKYANLSWDHLLIVKRSFKRLKKYFLTKKARLRKQAFTGKVLKPFLFRKYISNRRFVSVSRPKLMITGCLINRLFYKNKHVHGGTLQTSLDNPFNYILHNPLYSTVVLKSIALPPKYKVYSFYKELRVTRTIGKYNLLVRRAGIFSNYLKKKYYYNFLKKKKLLIVDRRSKKKVKKTLPYIAFKSMRTATLIYNLKLLTPGRKRRLIRRVNRLERLEQPLFLALKRVPRIHELPGRKQKIYKVKFRPSAPRGPWRASFGVRDRR